MGLLWLIKLWWLWVIIGLLILIPSILPPGISIIGTVLGGVMTLLGGIAGKAMSSEGFRNRINRNL